jgi:hypothetical protein
LHGGKYGLDLTSAASRASSRRAMSTDCSRRASSICSATGFWKRIYAEPSPPFGEPNRWLRQKTTRNPRESRAQCGARHCSLTPPPISRGVDWDFRKSLDEKDDMPVTLRPIVEIIRNLRFLQLP